MLLPFRKRAQRIISVLLFALLVGGLISIHGDFSQVSAQSAPQIDQVISKLHAFPGFINTYRTNDGKLAMEITGDLFGKDFIVVVQMAKGIGEDILLAGFPLVDNMMTFRMRNDKIELVSRNPNFRADSGTPLASMVNLGFSESVYATFPIIARDDEKKRYLIDATYLFVDDWANLSDYLPYVYGVGFGLDRSRSALASVQGFPRNVEIGVDLMFASSGPIPSVNIPDSKTLPISIHYSILQLPDEPMKPRLADDRIGYFDTPYLDYSHQATPSETVRLINRWRLEKKDPYAPLSEPVKPIVFYLENTIPTEFRPYIKAGVEEWNKAFEAAGFKNAIVAMDEPNDPSFDPGDARYSTIRWVPSIAPIFGAIGPSDVDPRSGEILNADILVNADNINAVTGQWQRYVGSSEELLSKHEKSMEAARALNPKYAGYLCDIDETLTDQMMMLRYTLIADGTIGMNDSIPMEYVGAYLKDTIMHEVGHTLGLRHNFEATTSIPYDQLQNKAYAAENGISASVMDYLGLNISPDRTHQGDYFTPTVGSYDVWAIQYGYLPVGNETLETNPQLAAIAKEYSKPGHQYGTDEDVFTQSALDPKISQNDLSDDPIKYFNDVQTVVDRVWTDLEKRVVGADGELWPLRNTINRLLNFQTAGYVNEVTAIGGVNVTRAHSGDKDGITPLKVLSAQEQRDALSYVLTAFKPGILREFPKELLDKAIPERFWPDQFNTWVPGTRFTYPLHDIVTGIRTLILSRVFLPERMDRIRDNAYRSDEANPFSVDELYRGFTNTIWADVLAGKAPSDSFQRAIQSEYLNRLITQATGAPVLGNRFAGDTAWTGNDPSPLKPNELVADAGAFQAPGVNDARAMAFAELTRIHDAIEKVLSAGGLDAMSQAHLMEAAHRIEKALQK
jgi:hypothetical protein